MFAGFLNVKCLLDFFTNTRIQFFDWFGYSEKFPNLKDKDWILTLTILVDICDHLNALNLSLQGKNKIYVSKCNF